MVPLELFVVNIQSSAVDNHLTVRRSQLTGCSGENPHGLRSVQARQTEPGVEDRSAGLQPSEFYSC